MSDVDMLPMDLPALKRGVAAAVMPTLVCGCGNPDWMAVRPGTLSTAEVYPASNIVALRADDGVASEAWCWDCWSARFGAPKS